jgi:hypothetical protein
MNERIRELAREAERQVYPVTSLYNEDSTPRLNSEFEKKFAELIVRECIAKAEEEAERYLGFPNLENADVYAYANAMYNYQELLKEHFGVKE